jgi:hypothetical protein
VTWPGDFWPPFGLPGRPHAARDEPRTYIQKREMWAQRRDHELQKLAANAQRQVLAGCVKPVIPPVLASRGRGRSAAALEYQAGRLNCSPLRSTTPLATTMTRFIAGLPLKCAIRTQPAASFKTLALDSNVLDPF